jgi:ABC-type multidrug transport system ATPase subunit
MMNAQDQAAEPAADVAVPILALEGITAGYGRVIVARDINLTVRPGTVDALIGANGAGKTTLLRVASGFLRPVVRGYLGGEIDLATSTTGAG